MNSTFCLTASIPHLSFPVQRAREANTGEIYGSPRNFRPVRCTTWPTLSAVHRITGAAALHKEKMETEFGFRVATDAIVKELNNGSHKNLAFSPLSLHICLNLLAAGAKGKTLDQLLRFLDAENVGQLNARSSRFMELVSNENPSGGGPTISLANGVWVDRFLSIKHSFKLLAGDLYKAKSESLDFSKAKEVAYEINAWARESSKGYIDEIVTSESIQGSVLVLANALYFKGSWLHRFDPSNTEDEDFRLLNGKRFRIPFMKQWNTHCLYGSFKGFKQLKMPYENGLDGKRYSINIFLPDQFDGLKELVQKFHSDLNLFIENHPLEYVKLKKLWLPKLKFEYGLELSESMIALGLDLPFRGKAELTEIVDQGNVCVSKVLQKSYIELNEVGTVAASITISSMATCSLHELRNPPPSESFVADHPFLFVIKEENTGFVLFVGAALNPLS